MHGSTPARIRICHWENSYFIVPCLAALALLRNIRVTRLLMVVVTADRLVRWFVIGGAQLVGCDRRLNSSRRSHRVLNLSSCVCTAPISRGLLLSLTVGFLAMRDEMPQKCTYDRIPTRLAVKSDKTTGHPQRRRTKVGAYPTFSTNPFRSPPGISTIVLI